MILECNKISASYSTIFFALILLKVSCEIPKYEAICFKATIFNKSDFFSIKLAYRSSADKNKTLCECAKNLA